MHIQPVSRVVWAVKGACMMLITGEQFQFAANDITSHIQNIDLTFLNPIESTNRTLLHVIRSLYILIRHSRTHKHTHIQSIALVREKLHF